MAGLSEKERKDIECRDWERIAAYLNTKPWEWVLVLTISDDPRTRMQRMSNKTLMYSAYPDFLRSIQTRLGVVPQDFWAAERGSETGRINVNVLLTLNKLISARYLANLWNRVSASNAEVYEYDAEKGSRYWMKDIVNFEADVLDYGGRVIGLPAYGAEEERTRPFRRSHYASTRPRYRPQVGTFTDQREIAFANRKQRSTDIAKLVTARGERQSQHIA